jgi:hypothetical protein
VHRGEIVAEIHRTHAIIFATRSAIEQVENVGQSAKSPLAITPLCLEQPNCGARAIIALDDGRLFFSAHDAGAIGEVIPRG